MNSREILCYENLDMTSLVTPVKYKELDKLLRQSKYDPCKSKLLVHGFKHGFSLGYQGPTKVKMKFPNLKLNCGDEVDLWNKVMKEVKLKRFAGPFTDVPFQHYIQSPIGLVPKDNGKNTRLIFHLSYPRVANSPSVNANIPEHLCKVKYPDISDAIRLCLRESQGQRNYFQPVYMGRSDISAAFRNVCIAKEFWPFLVMKARSPMDGKWYYFFDKCLSFGASISCTIYQMISDAVTHILRYRTKKKSVNYLDDNFFCSLTKKFCNGQVNIFMEICKQIGLPIAIEKTIWASTLMVFLGFLLDTVNQCILIPCEKVTRGLNMIQSVLKICRSKKAAQRKITVLQLQRICGFLNFLSRAIIPGRAFTRRLYAPLSNSLLKPHFHLRVTMEMQSDLGMWETFLWHQSAFCRPFADFAKKIYAQDIKFAMDASKNSSLGFGGHCGLEWMQYRWGNFIKLHNPSIQYLELFALVAGILAWIHKFPNRTVLVKTDNKSVKSMVNRTMSKCRNCMVLVRKLVLHSLIHNVKIRAVYLRSAKNKIADSLSRFQNSRFSKLSRKHGLQLAPTQISEDIWPIEKIWLN